MTDAEKILKEMPSVKMGIDDFYGRQTVLNALNKALSQVNKNDLLGVVIKCSTCNFLHDDEDVDPCRTCGNINDYDNYISAVVL